MFQEKLSREKDFYEGMIKQLLSNKILQKALQDPEMNAAFISALLSIKKELETE